MTSRLRMLLLLTALTLITGCAAKWQQGEVVVVQEDTIFCGKMGGGFA